MKICLLAYAHHHIREIERFSESFIEEKDFLKNFIIYDSSGRNLNKENWPIQFDIYNQKECFFVKLIKYFLEKCTSCFFSLNFVMLGIVKFFLFKSFLKKKNIDTVIVFEANIGYGSEFFFKACKQKKIRLFIMPYSFSDWLEPCISYYHKKDRSFEKIPFWASKKWFKKFQGKHISRLPPFASTILNILGFSPHNPTAEFDSSIGTFILESDAFCHHLVRDGVSPDRMVTLGGYNLFLLDKANKKRVVSHSIKKNIILFQIPPDITQTSYFFDLNGLTYSDYLSKIFELFEKYKENTIFEVISHPLTDFNENIILCSNVVVRKKANIYESICEGDAYIACISSTIRWALSMNLPVINFDLYKFGYPDFSTANNLAFVDNLQDFELMLERLIQQLSSTDRIGRIFPGASEYWGKLDNSFSKNLIKYLS